MSLYTAWQARSAGPSGPDIEVSMLRVMVAGTVTAYLAWFYGRHGGPWTPQEERVMWGLAAWLLVAAGLLALNWVLPKPAVWRRALGILLDVVMVTTALYIQDARGFAVAPIYLFVIFSSGFRFGRAYLFLAQVLSIAGWMIFAGYASWWDYRPDVAGDWLIALVVLPLYVSVCFGRFDAARVAAEQALKECVDTRRVGVEAH